MMNCERVRQLLSREHDGRPAGREAGAVAAHLTECPACLQFRSELPAIRGRLYELEEWQPSAARELTPRALARWRTLQSLPAPARRPRLFFPMPLPAIRHPLLGALALALLALLLSRAGWQRQRDLLMPAPRIALQWAPIPPARPSVQHQQPVAPPSLRRTLRQSPNREVPPTGKAPHSPSLMARRDQPRPAGARAPRPAVDDLTVLNAGLEGEIRQWVSVPHDEWQRIEDRVRAAVHVHDDFITIQFLRIASVSDRAITQAVESYKREAAIVDPRLAHEVTCAFKATALSDLCDQLKAQTGIQLSAGPSVADEKVTVFCEKLPLRDVMRQLSRPFGYTWLRSRQALGVGRQASGEGPPDPNAQRPTPNAGFRYELVQDLRSQLLEEELRNRDRDAALIALDREMSQYRPYLSLSPDEALARAQTAGPEEKKWLEQLGSCNWGPIQMYFRLSPQELVALRAGQKLAFSQAPKPGEEPLPADMERRVLECLRDVQLFRREGGYDFARPKLNAESLPLTAIPEARAGVAMSLVQSEVGQFTLQGSSRFTTGSSPDDPGGGRSKGPFAVGMSQAAPGPDSALTSATVAHDPTLRPRVSVQPRRDLTPQPPSLQGKGESPGLASDRRGVGLRPPSPSRGGAGGGVGPEPKVTSADVLEALHRASGMPIVADYYTRLYPVETVSVRDRPLFETLNQLAEAMRLRWNKEGGWLQLRSASFYNDRLKEVPNRLLARWSAARRQHGILTLDDLAEIAQLPDAPLDASEMAEGARDCWGLVEWELARGRTQRPHLRYLAQLTPAQRQEALGPTGLAFTRMSLAQQQQFISLMIGSWTDALQSLEELAGAALRVAYTQPGGFEWSGLGPANVHLFRPSPVRARTREAVLEAARRIDPQVDPAQIVPTELALTILYTSNPRPGAFVHVERATLSGCYGYDGRPDARPHGTKP